MLKKLKLTQCQLCRQNSEQLLCDVCWHDLPRYDWDQWNYNLLTNPQVRKGFSKLSFDRLLSIADYQQPYIGWITGLKFQRQIINQTLFAQLITNQLQQYPDLPEYDLIIAVPLHQRRWIKRGYNQAALIAKRLAKTLGTEYRENLVSRVKATSPQTEMSAAKRRNNLQGAFKINHSPSDLSVLLVDDVITTGSTLNELSQQLKLAGASRVDVFTICIAKL